MRLLAIIPTSELNWVCHQQLWFLYRSMTKRRRFPVGYDFANRNMLRLNLEQRINAFNKTICCVVQLLSVYFILWSSRSLYWAFGSPFVTVVLSLFDPFILCRLWPTSKFQNKSNCPPPRGLSTLYSSLGLPLTPCLDVRKKV